MRYLNLSIFLLLLLSLGSIGWAADGWHTLHGNWQRHGYYADGFPAKNLKLIWRKELYKELTGPRAEVIVGGGLAYMGTYAGNMYAWDAKTGEKRWVFQAGGAIGHSPTYHEGILYFGSMDGRLYAVDTQTGEKKWHFQTREGIWSSPAIHQKLVLFGSRDQTFYALKIETGQLAWTFETNGPILQSASIAEDGSKVVFASEDMHLYCLAVDDGALVWQTPKLPGLSFRDYFPVIIGETILLTTNPVKDFHTILGENQQMLLKWAGYEGQKNRYIFGSPEKIANEQKKIIAFLKDNPAEQTLFAFDLKTGRQPWIAPVLYSGGLHNPMTPPCYDPQNDTAYVYVRSAYSVWDGGGEVRPYTGVGKLNIQTGDVTLIEHAHKSNDPSRPAGRKDMPWMSFNTIGDETQALAASPAYLFSIHQGYIGSMHFDTGLCKNLYGKRDTYGGFYGPGNFGWKDDGGLKKAREAEQPYGIVNEWHGPARSIVSVVGKYVYYHVGSQVLCLKGEFN